MSDESVDKDESDVVDSVLTFKSLGLDDQICEACEAQNWTTPSEIQIKAIPVALEGRDIIGLAETGSGKTGAFALPIINDLLKRPQKQTFALILTPTRELAQQISEQFKSLGSFFKIKCAVLVGGLELKSQKLELEKKPHVIIATPGRLVQHLKETKGFSLLKLKYIVMDEADRMLNPDFQIEVDFILMATREHRDERRTYLFSATMTKKVEKLKRAFLKDPVLVEVSHNFQTVANLTQSYLFIPSLRKEAYLVYLLNDLQGKSIMIFCDTCANTQRLAFMLRSLGFNAIPLYGQMPQNQRLGSLNKFRSKDKAILVATDVASRGLDIPHVDVVINLYIPTHSKDYIHRVGRTARAGRAGEAFTFVTQYNVLLFLRIEQLLKYKINEYKDAPLDEVMQLKVRVDEAMSQATLDMSKENQNKGRKRKRGQDDHGDQGAPSGVKRNFKSKNAKRKKF